MTSIVPAGWYPDPASGERQRHFDGLIWSPWVYSAVGMTLAPMGGDAEPPGGVAVTRVILKSAAADGVVTSATLVALLRYTEQYETPHVPTRSPTGPTVARDRGVSQPPVTAKPRESVGPLFPAKVPGRSPASRWWQETRETVKSDLAVHGLAYLGVLLLFAGVFGLVVWSFSDINTAMRPVAELAIPGALFAAAAMLRRRGTNVVAGALEIAGGLLLPIVTVASLVDGAPVPPDPSGIGLTVGLAVATLAISCSYALWVRLHPTSALAYLVAPVMWLALGLLSLSWLDPIPAGEAVATPRAAEVAVMTAAAGVTLLLARARPNWPLAQATLTTGPTALGVLAVLALLAGANDGWPSTPAVMTAAGVVVGLEALATRLPGQVLTIASSVSVGLGLLAARSGLDESPWVAALAFAAATGWADFHRRLSTGRERRSYAVPTAVFPLGVALALVAAFEWPAGLLVAATLLLVVAFIIRVVDPSDEFWTRWVTGAVGAVAAALVAAASVDVSWPAAASTEALVGNWQPTAVCVLLAGALIAAPPRRPSTLPWALVALVAEAWAFTVPLLDAPETLVAAGWASAAAAVVVVAELTPRPWLGRVPTRLLTHLELASLALGFLAWIVAIGTPSTTTATLAIVTGPLAVAWATVSAADELRGSSVVDVVSERLAGRAAEQVRWLAPIVAAVATVVAVLAAVEYFGWVTDYVWWPVVPLALAALFIGLAQAGNKAMPRLARVAVEASLLLSVVAAVVALATNDDSIFAPTLIVLLTVLAVCAAVPRRLRDSRPAWLAWTTSAALVLVLADEWAETGDPRSQALLIWGSVALLFGLTVERLPRNSRLRVLTHYTLPPVALGGVGLTLGALLIAVTKDTVTTGWWFLLVAAVCAAAALLSGEGALIGIAALASTVSYAALAPWDPVTNATTLVACGGVWLVAADAARAWPLMRSLRHAISSLFWSGQIVIVAALPFLVDDAHRPLGLGVVGLLAIGVALRIPVPTARPWYAVVGMAFVLVGAADAGPGWLAVALAALSAASTTASALGRRLSQRGTRVVRWLGAVSAAAAWASFTVWADWSDETTVIATALAAGLLAAAAGVVAQLRSAAGPWVEAWGGVALIAALASFFALTLPTIPREPAGQMVAAGLALGALGAALAAEPLGRAWLRIATVVLGALAVASYLYGASATSLEVVIFAAVLASGATVATAYVAATRRGTAWQPALFVAMGLSASAVLLPAVTELPDTTLLTVALAVVAAQCMVVGRVLGSPLLLMIGPPLLALSWMLYASAALSGNPQWYLVPIGLTLIVMAALLRSARRTAGKAISGTDVVALELAGVVFIAGASLIQMATDSLGYVLVALAEGAVFALWGAVTKVRRRLAAGVGVVVAAVVLLVAIPLTPLLPQWRGAALWVGVAALGLAAIVIATFIERGRAAVGAWVASLSSTLSGWE